jgi:hypothetical protein
MTRAPMSLAIVGFVTVAALAGQSTTFLTPSAPSAESTVLELRVVGPSFVLADRASSDRLSFSIPAGWITVAGIDMPEATSFASWREAHPEIPQDVAAALKDGVSTPGFSLVAFDAESSVDGFTPQMSVSWIDAPVGDLESWLAQQSATSMEDRGLVSTPTCGAWYQDPDLAVVPVECEYLYSMHDVAMAGSQMIVPVSDGRAVLFTLAWRTDQANRASWVASLIVGSL